MMYGAMEPISPATPNEMAEALATAAGEGRSITLNGASSKPRLSGPLPAADITISTTGLTRIIEYEPRDLTISVEAGLPFSELTSAIAKDGLMLALDPPFFNNATVGGVIAANCSGPRRRLYGTARDLVIGMKFATLEGNIVQSGGMVVKNAAGLEMGKLLIGSLGTLAAIVSVNFRLAPRPPSSRTFLSRHDSIESAIAARDSLIRGVLQPVAVDLLNPPAAQRAGLDGCALLVQAQGSPAVIERYSSELTSASAVDGPDETSLWEKVREFVPGFLAENPNGAVVRASSTITGIAGVMRELPGAALARAGSGVVYGLFDQCEDACEWVAAASRKSQSAVVEYVSEAGCSGDRWPLRGADFTMMEKVKDMFDPNHLLNVGRLYGRL